MNEIREEVAAVDEAAEPIAGADLDGTSSIPQSESSQGAPGSDFGHWLTGNLRPSASKSVPPPIEPAGDDAPVTTPQTLAPQVMSSEELDEEDLAVLPMGRRRSRSRSWLGEFAVAALGAAAAVLMFGYLWWQDAPEPGSDPEAPAVTAAPAAIPDEPTPLAPTSIAEPDAEQDNTGARSNLGRWIQPIMPAEGESDDTATGPRGPSVARFPDLPAAVWSYLRHAEREKAEPNSAASSEADSVAGQSE